MLLIEQEIQRHRNTAVLSAPVRFGGLFVEKKLPVTAVTNEVSDRFKVRSSVHTNYS